MVNNQFDLDGEKYETRQLIEYCFRLSSIQTVEIVDGFVSSILTFNELKQQNITAEHLIAWSSPIDLIERYQQFLEINNSSSTELFYNCTVPWFGSHCQYKFILNQTFSNIVEITFESKRAQDSYANFTCYMHVQCDRGSSLLCLDWREICDGKIDCLNGGDDEKYCDELYMNQCSQNEYQCRNGMCIDETFLMETGINNSPGCECLDQSDEPSESSNIKRCVKDPSFQCEDTVCPLSNTFTCGDGDCIPWPMLSGGHSCYNNRDRVFNYDFEWHNLETSQFSRCFKIGICSSNAFSVKEFETYCKKLCNDIQQCTLDLEHCPAYFFAPDFPVWDGHVRLGFFINQTLIKKGYPIIPHFICYDKLKCSSFNLTFELDNYTCLHSYTLNLSYHLDYNTIFISCIHQYQSIDVMTCSESSMIRCLGTNKCIPKRHIMDGIPDCYDAFDESMAANSCLLNDKYRFNCTSEKKCLSPTIVRDGKTQCIGNEDETYSSEQVTNIQQLPFSALCDGRQELFSSTNESDETNCEQWPCVNQYTRCNGIWNCPKGIDEINCPSKFDCPKDHHPCVFPKSETMGCLHLNHTDDGIIDCLGATDERTFCLLSYPHDENRRYRCWNDTTCVDYLQRCVRCRLFNDIDEFCSKPPYEIRDTLEYFQSMKDFYLGVKLPFFPQASLQFPVIQPSPLSSKSIQNQTFQTIEFNTIDQLDSRQAWYCHKGILIYNGKTKEEKCLCPPSYYGERCQYQNQRISLTLRFRNEILNRLHIIGIVIILIDQTGLIHSYNQLTYIPIHDCNTKFNINLLYRNRPKDMTKNYTVRVDAFDKINLIYLTSWILPVKFIFMPVNRVSAHLIIPAQQHSNDVACNLRNYDKNTNVNCKLKDSARLVIDQKKCTCSPDSLCLGIVNNQSICLCPLTKISPRCFIRSICQKNICMNGGVCVPYHDRISFMDFVCACPDGFSGKRCEHKDVQIDISFSDVPIPQSLLVHLITVREHDLESLNPVPIRATMFKKIRLDRDTVTFFVSLPFHLIFSQIESQFYLTVLQYNYTPSVIIPTRIASSQYCLPIRDFFNQTLLDYPILRRVKYYHNVCKKASNLICFHDSEMFMCLCTEERHANCFHFDFNMTYNCMGLNKCQNGGQCFQDNPTCPTKIMCVCPECFYGTQCQFSTQQFGLSLDGILGYQIHPHLPITRQSAYVKVSIAVATSMLIFGLIFGFLSILTFLSKPCLKVGCGIYLLASSITSILTLIFLNLKLWSLLLSQISVLTSRSYLTFSCISIDFILRCLIATTDWFHACVAAERLVTVIVDVKFNLTKSKAMAKLVITLVSLFTCISFLHDPIHRHLIDDEEEQRTWCMARFTSNIKVFNSFINIFHFILPFGLKLISAISIIGSIAKRRATTKKQKSYLEHIKKQLHKHKHLIISSSCLVILALPRLIISFSSGCMKSARKPLLFLIGYFVSFIPSLLTFFIFVSTSKTYEKQFKTVIKRKWYAIRRRFSGY